MAGRTPLLKNLLAGFLSGCRLGSDQPPRDDEKSHYVVTNRKAPNDHVDDLSHVLIIQVSSSTNLFVLIHVKFVAIRSFEPSPYGQHGISACLRP